MKCPGQDTAYWKSDSIYEILCPKCSNLIEFFKDDSSRKCKQCGHRAINPKIDFGCAAYCKHSKYCLGTLPKEFSFLKENLLKDRIIAEVKKYFSNDFIESNQIKDLAKYAENICKRELNCDLLVVICVSYLYKIKFSEVYESNLNGKRQKKQKGEELVEKIIDTLDINSELANEIYNILSQKNHQKIENINAKTVHDANIIVNFHKKLKGNIAYSEVKKQFLTSEGYNEAKMQLGFDK